MFAKILSAKMPADVEKEAVKQLNRLEGHGRERSLHDSHLSRLMVDLPWSKSTEDIIDIKAAKSVLSQITTVWKAKRPYFRVPRCSQTEKTI